MGRFERFALVRLSPSLFDGKSEALFQAGQKLLATWGVPKDAAYRVLAELSPIDDTGPRLLLGPATMDAAALDQFRGPQREATMRRFTAPSELSSGEFDELLQIPPEYLEHAPVH